MRKQKLKLLSIEQLPDTIETSQIADCAAVKHVFTAKTHATENEQILEVTFFSVKKRIPEFRTFFNHEDFIAEILHPQRKWSNSCIGGLYWYKEVTCANSLTSETILNFFGEQGNPLSIIDAFQTKQRKKRLSQKHKKIKDKIDAKMQLIKALPKGFEKWINDYALKGSRYIYYKRKGKVINGFCTVCHNDVVVEQAGHNASGICPLCKQGITFKAIGKSKKVVDSIRVSYIQETSDGFVVREFSVTKRYSSHYRNPELAFSEDQRHFINGSKVTSYSFGKFLSTNEYHWCEGIKSAGFNYWYVDYRSVLYTHNLPDALRNSQYRYSQIEVYAERHHIFDVVTYLERYLEYPALELLLKWQLWRLAKQVVTDVTFKYGNKINIKGTSIKEIFSINKDAFRFLVKIDGTYDDALLIREASNKNHRITKEYIEWVRENNVYEQICDIMKYVSLNKAINYIRNQNIKRPDNALHTITILWRDYLDNTAFLGYGMKSNRILFPSDIKKSHDEAVELVKFKEKERCAELIIERAAILLEKYFFQDEQFIVRPPCSVDEMIHEGNVLNHCVATNYTKKHAEGKADILFIRTVADPDTPFFTLEYSNGTVQQVHGKNHVEPPDVINKFIKKWLRKKHLTNVYGAA